MKLIDGPFPMAINGLSCIGCYGEDDRHSVYTVVISSALDNGWVVNKPPYVFTDGDWQRMIAKAREMQAKVA